MDGLLSCIFSLQLLLWDPPSFPSWIWFRLFYITSSITSNVQDDAKTYFSCFASSASSGTARMFMKPYNNITCVGEKDSLNWKTLRKMTNTLLAPHLKAEVAQSNAVSPAPSTGNIKVGKIRNRSTTGNIKVGKIRNRSMKAGGKCKNGAETAKNFTTWEVSTTLLLTCSSSIFSKDGEFLFSDENIVARRTAWHENMKIRIKNMKIRKYVWRQILCAPSRIHQTWDRGKISIHWINKIWKR